MGKDIRIFITPGSVAIALGVFLGAYVLWLLRDLVLLVLTAIIIASAIEPWIAFFIRWHLPRFLSALLVYVLVFGGVFSLLYFFFPPIVADAASFLSGMPKYLETLNLSGPLSSFASAGDLIATTGGGTQSFVQTLLSLQSVFTETPGGVVQLMVT